LKKVLSFFYPSKINAFINQDWKADSNLENTFLYPKVGYLLLKLMLKTPEGRNLLSKPPEGFLEFG
jgi:hypothetical protein